MGTLTVRALRVVLAAMLVGSVFVELVMVPLFWKDLDEASAGVRVPVVAIVVLGIVCVQVVAVCVWRLLTMVRRDTVFSDGAFRYVDVIAGRSTTASLLTFALGVVLAPGEDVAPGTGAADRRPRRVRRRRRPGGDGAARAAGPGHAAADRARRGDLMIVVDVDVMLARRKMSVGELADRVGITPANLAVLKNGRAKAVRFTTLEALCEALECQPGDLLRWEAGGSS